MSVSGTRLSPSFAQLDREPARSICEASLSATQRKEMINRSGISDYRARGFPAGVVAHGIGTARAFQVDEIAGVCSSLGMGMNALVTSFLVPLAVTALTQ
ncbi:hypothetical protein GPL17_22450 [Bradyrhizobium yuanmingense]|uniref:LrgB family protein n=1 Tax=Bradyrhizobium yuanmingense TaxID=108015 RepID=UPI0012F783F4|nr:LrgB family protein [Bradyrhizobium yuanmingense]MVT53236.1 hypothetical protein [Bradyrhizobium yuanmingense]